MATTCPLCQTGRLSVVRDGLIGTPHLRAMDVSDRPVAYRLTLTALIVCNTCEYTKQGNERTR